MGPTRSSARDAARWSVSEAVTSPANAQPAPAPGRNRACRGRWRAFSILTGLVSVPLVIIDQASKLYVSSHMTLYQSIPVIPHWFAITYTENAGAAFSIFATLPPTARVALLTTLSAAAIVVLLVLLARSPKITLGSFALALILGGAAGNLIDRAARGRVIDFIRLHYYGLSYPVFNVADSAITIGVTLVLLSSFARRNDTAG
jgi:signal peptidase II